MIKEAIYNRLTTTAAVNAIVPTGNIYLTDAAENKFPRIVYDYDTSWASGKINPDRICIVTLDIYCETFTQADLEPLQVAIYAAFDHVSGTWGGSRVQQSIVSDATQDYVIDDNKRKIYTLEITIDLRINNG